jgi:hypothetical protein
MDDLLHWLYATVGGYRSAVMVLFFGGWVVMAIGVSRGRQAGWETKRYFNNPLAIISLPVVVISTMCVIGISAYIDTSVEKETWTNINNVLSVDVDSVLVDGRSTAYSGDLVTSLRHMARPVYHHSHPLERHTVTIHSGGGSLTLEIAHDSEYQRQWWVYHPRYYDGQAVGSFLTDVLKYN